MTGENEPHNADPHAWEDLKHPGHPSVLSLMGPGLITGASDDDPSGIATYSQVGAQFGYGLGWTMLFSYPLMVAIQEISARIGRVTGFGIAANLKRHYPKWLSRSLILLLLVANIINLGADLGAMGAAVNLLIKGPILLYVILFGILCAGLEIFVQYARYVSILKWLCLSLFSYAACALVVHVPWGKVAMAIVWPHISLKPEYLMAIVAVLGTTISPYLFFWQAEEEVEDERESAQALPLVRASAQAPAEFRRIRIDTVLGMGISNLIALFIIITTGTTLYAHGITDIQTSAQAAEALRAVAGRFTFLIFAAGIIGTGLLTVPVLAGSAGYAVGESFAWRVGLARLPGRAKKFYAVIAVATLLGVGLNFTPINPIRALYWSAVINGVSAGPIMVMMMIMASRRKIMGEFILPRGLRLMGWLATIAMLAAAGAMMASWFE
jgi:NRAMP (natural resistance-associated macrophage protein)-like metal ion transporter